MINNKNNTTKYHTIFKIVHRDKPFVEIGHDIIKNPKLSLKAKGLLTLMLSFKDGWVFSMEKMSELSKDGMTSHKSAYKELKKAGHIKIEKVRDINNGKFIKYITTVSEEPMITTLPQAGKPQVGNRMSGKNTNNNNIDNNNKMSITSNTHGGGKPRRMKDDNLLLNDKDSSFSERYGAKIQNKLNLHSKFRPVSSKTWAKQINYLLQKMSIDKETFKEIINWYIKKGTNYQYSPKIYKPEHLVEKWNQLQDAMIKYTTDQSESHTNYRMGPDGEYGYYEDDD